MLIAYLEIQLAVSPYTEHSSSQVSSTQWIMKVTA